LKTSNLELTLVDPPNKEILRIADNIPNEILAELDVRMEDHGMN
jgi:hypothetical protein